MVKRAEVLLSKELDIVNFIKQQKYLKTAMKVLFSRLERTILCYNKELTLKKSKHAIESECSDVENDFDVIFESTPRVNKLLNLTVVNNVDKESMNNSLPTDI